MKPKVLFYDIETSPNLAYVWQQYFQYGGSVIEIAKEWELLSFAWKWQGNDKVHCLTRSAFKDETDKTLCKQLHAVLSQADLVIAHNGDSFDQKKARARFLFHSLPPLKPLQTIDTKKVVKKYFNLNSNSLNAIAKYLRIGTKAETGGFGLWLSCMAGDGKAWRKMAKYNKQDVVLLEKVYDKLRPWMTKHPALSGDAQNCRNCGSNAVIKQGIRANHVSRQQQMQCKDCKAWFLRPFKAD